MSRAPVSRSPSSRFLIRAAVASLLPGIAWAQEAAAEQPATEPLEEVVLVGRIVFTQNDAFGATKMGLPIKDTPQTVNVVTSDLIEVAGIRAFDDFYKVDASSGVTHSLDGWPRNYYRGFYQQGPNTVRVDGFRMPGNIELDMAVFDRFEVIKGPTSTLYGQNNVGGSLNAVSKMPQERTAAQFSLETAQHGFNRAEADLTGSLLGSDTWSYRLIGAYQDADSFIDYVRDDVELVSGAVQYRPSDQTRATLRYTHQKNDATYHYSPILQLTGNGTGEAFQRAYDEGLQFADIPRSRFFGMPWNRSVKTADFLQLQSEHRFAGDWTLRLHAQYTENEEHGNNFYVGGPFDENGEGNFMWTVGDGDDPNAGDRSKLFGSEINLFGDIEAFGRRHTLFFGVDYNDIQANSRSGHAYGFGYESSVFNAFDPDYSAVAPPSFDDYSYFYDSDTSTQLFGATIQLIARPTDRLSAMLGARYSEDREREISRFGLSPQELLSSDPDTSRKQYDEIVMQAGLTYALTDRYNAYASFGETFEPQFGDQWLSATEVRPIDPQTGRSFEIGVKGDLTEDLFVSAAAFDIKRNNIGLPDPIHFCCYNPVGSQRSRGVELGLQGRLLPQLSINASVAYLDSEYLDGNFVGLQATNAPKFGITVFGTYEILAGTLRGLGFGMGVVHKEGLKNFDSGWTDRLSEPPNPVRSVAFDFGGYTEVDARVFYGFGNWDVVLSATNLLNEKYYSPSFDQLWWATNVNPPSTVRARLTYRF